MKWILPRISLLILTQFASSFVVQRTNRYTLLSANKKNEEPDLFEYFDPLLSPHAYPKGISPDQEPVETEHNRVEPPDSNSRKRFGFRTPGNEQERPKEQAASTTASEAPVSAEPERPQVDTSVTFDPTISPHAYEHGTPDVVVGDKDAVYLSRNDESSEATKKRVGVLLMDHGSRNPASNQRLHDLARLYEESLSGDDSVIVKAAHMEIATPTIQQGIQALLDQEVDEIVCHPYFLSPGRHVREDLPRIIAETVDTLEIEIPVSITDPLGSETDIMLDIIHKMVQQTATVTVKRRIR